MTTVAVTTGRVSLLTRILKSLYVFTAVLLAVFNQLPALLHRKREQASPIVTALETIVSYTSKKSTTSMRL